MREYDKHNLSAMRQFILLLLFCSLLFGNPGIVQSAPSPQPESTTPNPETEEPAPSLQLPNEDESSAATDEEKESDKGQAETSWERLNAERQADMETSPAEEPPNSFNPVVLWRMLRSFFRNEE